jgi:transposase
MLCLEKGQVIRLECSFSKTILSKRRMTMSQEKTLLFGIEVGNQSWKLCFSDGSKFRHKSIPARDQAALLQEVKKAKEKFKLPADCPVLSCYEAGRDGFWIHRFLEKNGIENLVLDPASIEVNRRHRRTKTDKLDAEKMTRLLIRWKLFEERKAFSVVRVPSEAEEDGMRTYREREKLKKEETGHINRIKSLLILHGIQVEGLVKCCIEKLVDWKGEPLPPNLIRELEREQERLELVRRQLQEIERYQKQQLKRPKNKAERQGQQMTSLLGVGVQSSWVLSHEFFSWRQFENRKQVGACAGLVGTPYASGESSRDQGISKAGNRRIRAVMVELAWCWLRYQPNSELSRWFERRFGQGSKRMRRVGIVAMARKLLIALWNFVESGDLPEGAVLGNPIG